MNKGARPLDLGELRRVVHFGREFVAAITWYAAKYRKPGFHPGEAIEPVLDAAQRLWMATEGRSPADLIPSGFPWDSIACYTTAEAEQRTPLRMARESLRALLRRIGYRNEDANPNMPSTRGVMNLEPDDSLPELADLVDALDEIERLAGPEPPQPSTADAQLARDEADGAPSAAPRKNRTRKENERALIKAIKKATAAAQFGWSIETMAKSAGVAPSSAKLIFKDEDGAATWEWSAYTLKSKERRPPGK